MTPPQVNVCPAGSVEDELGILGGTSASEGAVDVAVVEQAFERRGVLETGRQAVGSLALLPMWNRAVGPS